MAFMLYEDESVPTKFKSGSDAWYQQNLSLDVTSWSQPGSHGSHCVLSSLTQLREERPCALRIILAPLDAPGQPTTQAFLSLANEYGIPPSFLTERLQSVPHSFGHRKSDDGSQCFWFHHLSKAIHLETKQSGDHTTYSIRNAQPRSKHDHQSESDDSWIKTGFFLRVDPAPKQQSTAVSHQVTLLCFGPTPSLQKRLEQLRTKPTWDKTVADPFILFAIIVNELYLLIDEAHFNLRTVFAGAEKRILDTTSIPSYELSDISFVSLYNYAKHSTHVSESAASLLHTITRLQAAATAYNNPSGVSIALLEYQNTLLIGLTAQTASLDKRITATIQLAYNLVTQHDSRIIQVDSKLMMLIALVTVLFLPANTVAAIFGSEFFSASFVGVSSDQSQGQSQGQGESEAMDELHVLRQFWLFWLIVLPLTLLLVAAGYLYWKNVRRRVFKRLKAKAARSMAQRIDVGEAKQYHA